MNPSEPQYNGNIAAVKYRTDYNGTVVNGTMHYRYDGKYQLVNAGPADELDDTYRVKELSYDANGNIRSVVRHDALGDILVSGDTLVGDYFEHSFTGVDGNGGYIYQKDMNRLKKVVYGEDDGGNELLYAAYEYDRPDEGDGSWT